MDLELTILGASSAIPLTYRHPTSQFLTIAGRHFLLDCGEGTQVRLRENNIGFGRIDHIFLSHLHGDHYFGLAPLLNTLNLLDRRKELHVYSLPGIKEAVEVQMKLQGSRMRYEVIYHDLDTSGRYLVHEDEKVEVYSFPLNHSIPCCGFLFQEKPASRKMSKSALHEHNIPVSEIRRIKAGGDWIDENGQKFSNEELTSEAAPPLSYAYCTDTAPTENLKEYINMPNLMYHEATFTNEHQQRAKKTKHSTAAQAAEAAKTLEAGELIIGHYSVRYEELDELLREAREIFPSTHLAIEGHKFRLPFSGNRILKIEPAVKKIKERKSAS